LESGDVVKVIQVESCYTPITSLGLAHCGTPDVGTIGIVQGCRIHPDDQGKPSKRILVDIHCGSDSFLMGYEGLELVSRQHSSPAAIMEQLWASRTLSGDVRIVAGGHDRITVHSCILETASPVFAAALQAGMKETATREIEVPDSSAVVVTGVLQILYVNSMPDNLDLMQALAFAHKYQIAEAAAFLAPRVISTLTADSLVDAVRFLRDFDGCCDSEQKFLDQIVERVSADKSMLKKHFQLL